MQCTKLCRNLLYTDFENDTIASFASAFIKVYTGTIISLTAPNPPTGLMVTQVTDTSVIVSWTPPTDTTGVTGYRIFYTEDGGSEQSRDVSGGTTNMDMIPDLITGKTYTITVVATSDGLPSEVVGPVMVELIGMRCAFITGNFCYSPFSLSPCGRSQ